MRRVQHIFCVCAFLIGICAHAHAQKDGSTCYKAIPIGKDYTVNISSAQTVWYSARTFDLPLAVYFIPQNETDPAPEVEMDFSCTSGIYSDPIICMLFCKGGTVTMPMPHRPPLDTTRVEGQLAYYISMGKSYRDLLLKMGVDYNVDVVIKVTYHSAGSMSIAPDGMFSSCVEVDKIVHLGDSIPVEANDKESYVIVPYVQWQYDSIQYEWTGTTPCILSVGNNCSFDPTSATDDAIMDGGPNSPSNPMQPGAKWKVTSGLLMDYVSDTVNYPNEAGMFFAKFYSSAPGGMKITKIPTLPPRADAIIMRYDHTYALNAHDTVVYAMPKTWVQDLQFTTPTTHLFRMYIASDPDFSQSHVIDSLLFSPSNDGHILGLLGTQLKEYWKKAIDQYLYVRFDCSEATTVTPALWKMSECVKKWSVLPIGRDVQLQKGDYESGQVYYRIYYASWRGGDVTFQWKSTQNGCTVYIGDNCSFAPSSTDEHVVIWKSLSKNSRWTIPASTIEEWGERVDEEGYLYVRFNAKAAAKMLITSTAPAETDPEYPTATVIVGCDNSNQLYVEVKKAQTVIIKNEAGTAVKTFTDAQPDYKYFLSELGSGTYTLQGETETITINL